MRVLLARRPSGAMMVALTALVVAAGGTAIAASGQVSGDKLIKKGSLSGNRLRNGTVTGKQVRVSTLGKVPRASAADTTATAKFATNAGHAATADTATNATNATNANTIAGKPLSGITSRAYAFVNSDGTLDAARSKNIASVTLVISSSAYCVVPTASSGIDSTAELPVVSADDLNAGGSFHVAELVSNAGALCAGGWLIFTYNIAPNGTTTFAPSGFSLIAP